MFIIYILTAIAVIYTLVGAYTDIRWRIFPDYLSYSLILFGLFGNLFLSIETGNSAFFANSVLFLILAFSIGYFLSYFGLWGMGDTKILAGFAAVFSIWPSFQSFPLFQAPWPFVVTIWLNAVLLAPFLAVAFMTFHIIKNRKKLLILIRKKFQKYRKVTYIFAASLVLFSIIYFTTPVYGLYFLVLWAFAILFTYFSILAKIMDSNIYELKKPSELIEGDYPIELKLKIPGKLKKWGLEKNQINYIKSHTKKQLKIKRGFPMIVAYAFSLLISLFSGDLTYKIIYSLIHII